MEIVPYLYFFLFLIQNLLQAYPLVSSPYGWGKHAVAEGCKTTRFLSCQGHKISLAISNCPTSPAFLFGENVMPSTKFGVFVHLFLMDLLHRLQEQADSFDAREVAVSMGLANHTSP
ncbi:hypothetical protein RHGRI_013198 [Rhododendron griersonianum]|uniref:Uncharacterized protein n=1 Tax=Rhododendron griersonianum TaxID=479676 RepID=A0AAV6K4S4_9ERIC|nr:hypothetical protein RHGRI_013198 [Rhododendron griersonianum]